MSTFRNISLALLFIVAVVTTVVITRYFFPIRIPVTNTIVDVQYRDTVVYKDTTIYKPYPVKVEVPIDVVHIPEDYDSLKNLYSELYQLYHTLKRYEEKILLDTIGEIDVHFTVSKNSLDSLNAEYSYKVYEKIVTITNEVYQNNWYLYGETDFNSVGLGVLYTTQNYMVGGGYNFNTKSVQVGAGINISKLWK